MKTVYAAIVILALVAPVLVTSALLAGLGYWVATGVRDPDRLVPFCCAAFVGILLSATSCGWAIPEIKRLAEESK